LSGSELESVADELHSTDTKADRFTLLEILGRSGATSYRSLVETYLDSSNDPMLASLALRVLCFYWDLTPHYIDQILQFLDGVFWDTGKDCKLTAINIAGEHLRDHLSKELLGRLLDIFRTETEDKLIREATYSALARAMGKGYNEIPSAARSFDLECDIDPEVIDLADSRLQLSG
jgi:hypothetical protein